ncbi:ferrous iron transporter B [Candidatus Paraluminiphilus aquimaris]|uniref:Ferrous iron transport protein B n=1 Tax=Candidatus Paraluminiphilus aquimaris TaxID=2518994 RepID=A0ABY6Q2X5_9GAMM|nr:ferrous iron transporter B [Candidatus Paraluminiphilus aquimaris]UZP73284.1 ferrous iron transporter B [Candidatus Paraluminiphilus aquimaris]
MKNILLVGAPNSGKSALFNQLTGLSHKVANYPGITVDVGTGALRADARLTVWDFPGTYSLTAVSGEEQVAIDTLRTALKSEEQAVVAMVCDATRLEKSATYCLQVARECAQAQKPFLVLLNMMDVIESDGLDMDVQGLSKALGVPVFPVSARTGKGLSEVEAVLVSSTPEISTWGDTPDALISGTATQIAERFAPKGDLLVRRQAKLDNWLLGTLSGGVAFVMIMTLFFQAIFTWAAPLMDGVESIVIAIGSWASSVLPDGVLADFVNDAIFGGLGAFLVFAPLVFILTMIVGALEDSGYLARAALICHRPLSFFGLSGKSFVPLLSGVACAIPAIYAARTMSSRQERLLTYVAIPLMPCSARLPVYALLIAILIPDETVLGGIIGWQGLAMSGIYFFGIMTALIVAAVVSRMGDTATSSQAFILELPAYRMPALKPIVSKSLDRVVHFIRKAGSVIFAVTVVVWFLGYFPNGGEDLSSSWLAALGRFIEPVFSPLGLDWRYGVAIIASFLAREVFVGTLGTIFGIESADEDPASLADQIAASGLTAASGVALVVFFTIALQCVSTVALLAREAKSARFAVQLLLGYLVLAWLVAWLVYSLVSLLLL